MLIGRQIRGQLNEVLGRFNNPNAVQGVRIEYDSYWLQQLQQWVSVRSGWGWFHPFHPEEFRHWEKWYEDILENPRSFEPPFWRNYVKANRLGEGSAVIVTFVLRDPKAIDQFSEGLQGALPGYQTRVEYHPQVRGFAATASASTATVGVTSPNQTNGTLGGMLRDRSRASKQYIVSCAHVLSDTAGTDVFVPSPPQGGKTVVASVSYGIMAPAMSTGASCSKDTTSEYPVDAAAAEVSRASSIPSGTFPKIDAVKAIKLMSQRDPVWFTGAVSGRVKGQINSLSIWQEIEIGSQFHCFGNLFVVEPPKPWYLNTNLAQPGDSGAWILSTDGFAIDWNGMLIGGDGAFVYCSFAEKIVDEFNKGGVDAVVL